MVAAYSNDLRIRVVEAIEAGLSRRAAVVRFGVSIASAVRWHQRYRRLGDVTADRTIRRTVQNPFSAPQAEVPVRSSLKFYRCAMNDLCCRGHSSHRSIEDQRSAKRYRLRPLGLTTLFVNWRDRQNETQATKPKIISKSAKDFRRSELERLADNRLEGFERENDDIEI